MFRHVSFCLFVLLFACSSMSAQSGSRSQPDKKSDKPSLAEKIVFGAIEHVGKGALEEAGKQVANRLFDMLLPSERDGSVSTAKFKQLLDHVLQVEKLHGDTIRKLQGDLREKMTREEVHELLMRHLTSINKQLAEVARKVQEQRDVLSIHQMALSMHRKDIDQLFKGQDQLSQNLKDFRAAVNEEFGIQRSRIRGVEDEMVRLREDYPRYKPVEQAEQLGVTAMQFLQKKDHREALRAFRFAHAYDEGDPCYLYGMALSYKGLKQSEEAELYAARGVAADRKHSLVYSRVWTNMSERLQGADRNWLESLRWDPVYGVKASGMIRVPQSLSQP